MSVIMGWLSRRRARKLREMREIMQENQVPSMAEAFLAALGKFADMQMQFSKNLADVNVKRSAALIGSRGGRRTQANWRAKKIGTSCAWCKGDSSVAALEWHRANHLNTEPPGKEDVDVSNPQ